MAIPVSPFLILHPIPQLELLTIGETMIEADVWGIIGTQTT